MTFKENEQDLNRDNLEHADLSYENQQHFENDIYYDHTVKTRQVF